MADFRAMTALIPLDNEAISLAHSAFIENKLKKSYVRELADKLISLNTKTG
jgi:hypothetical protein